MPAARISFVGDDFTGSTDAMESLALEGLNTILFTRPPTPAMLAACPDLDAFGVATRTRSMKPGAMAETLRPIFAALARSGAQIIHYKICSTFDSSPTIGNLGVAIDAGIEAYGVRSVPLLVGVPSLGRYCTFGNLFARYGAAGDVFRLDRHPSISKHPVTPMTEADLRSHLAKQTSHPIGLFDVRQYDLEEPASAFDALTAAHPIVLIDCDHDSQLSVAGKLLSTHRFVIGSSGVGQALVAHWRKEGALKQGAALAHAAPQDQIFAVCGSCSPVTVSQVRWAVENGFAEVVVSPQSDASRAAEAATAALKAGKSVVIHTAPDRNRIENADETIGLLLGDIARQTLARHRVQRIAIAGGDTSGRIADVLGIESMRMTAKLIRGAPLCTVTAPDSPADGCEITFKGGQIGGASFLNLVLKGKG